MLRREGPRARLTERVAGVDRLVLLGDLIELRHGPVREALAAATPVLRELGAAAGPDAEIVIVPGNHDHALVAPWRERSTRRGPAPPLGLEAAVDSRAGEPLASVARALAPATVRAAYPGVWLRDDVYATHGHYCDRHTTIPMLERIGAGAMARIVGQSEAGPTRAEDYEATLAPMYAWIHAIAQHGGPDLGASSHGASAAAWGAMAGPPASGRRARVRRRVFVAGFPVAIATLNRLGIGPLSAELNGSELRRAGLRALGEVIARLQIEARHVIFGHTHRAGPLTRDPPGDWLTPGGTLLTNTGSWVHEPGFLGRDPASSPYRAGFGVLVSDDDGAPQLLNMLD
jgi:hypothetical protein